MLLPRTLRKLLAIFRGDAAPILVFLSVFLGLWFGLMPSWSGVHAVLLVLALVLNVHFGMFALFAGLGRALCYAAAPAWYHLGDWVQHALAPLLDFIGSLPILGLTDFARYAVAGGFVAGGVGGLLAGGVMAYGVTAFRRKWLALEEKSEAFKKWQRKGWVRWADWFLFGKRTQDVRAALQKKTRVIRIPGVIAAVVLLAAAGGAAWAMQGDRLSVHVVDALTQVNGAEVNVAELELAPFAGRASAAGLAFTNPSQPAHNRLVIGQVVADANLWNLLRGRIVIDDVRLEDVQLDVPRETPGMVTTPVPPAQARAADDAAVPAARRFDIEKLDLAAREVARLEEYLSRKQTLEEWLNRVQAWLPAAEATAPRPPTPQTYLGHLTARAPVPPVPRVVVSHAVITNVQIPSPYIGRATVTCANLSDAPAAYGRPLTIDIQSQDRPTHLKFTQRYDGDAPATEVAGEIRGVELASLQQSLSSDNPVVFEGGTADTELSGTASAAWLDLRLRVATRNMQVRTTGDEMFGLDPRVTSEALRAMENITTTLRLVGPLDQPRLAFDGDALAAKMKDALVSAGKAELARQLDQALADQLPAGAPGASDVLEDPLGKGADALGGLLGQQNNKQDAPDDEPATGADEQEKPSGKDLLGGLRERLKKDKK